MSEHLACRFAWLSTHTCADKFGGPVRPGTLCHSEAAARLAELTRCEACGARYDARDMEGVDPRFEVCGCGRRLCLGCLWMHSGGNCEEAMREMSG